MENRLFVKIRKVGHSEEVSPAVRRKQQTENDRQHILDPVPGALGRGNLPELSASRIFSPTKQRETNKYGKPDNRNEAIELFNRGREERDKRARESSEKIKKKIISDMNHSILDSKKLGTESTDTHSRTRSIGGLTASSIRDRHHMSLDYGRPKPTKEDTQVNNLKQSSLAISQEQVYSPKLNFKVISHADKVIKPRQEEYNENIFESLLPDVQKYMESQVKKYVFQQDAEQERVETFARLLISGLYASKFLDKKMCLYTPQKILLPKIEVLSNLRRVENLIRSSLSRRMCWRYQTPILILLQKVRWSQNTFYGLKLESL